MTERFIVAIDLGGTNLKIALLNLNCRIIDKAVLSTRFFSRKEALISTIIQSIRNILRKNKIKKPEVLGIGLGLPGPIDVKRGIVHFFPNIPGWRQVHLKGILERKTGLPVVMDNDANLMCLGEYGLGAAKGCKNAIGITLGTGVGAGIIIEDRLYRGSDNATGEIGHVPLNENGPRCNCGGRACLERYIGNNIIARQIRRAFRKSITLEELSLLARKGNPKAIRIWEDVGTHLGIALTTLVNLLNPDVIVLGGGVANAGKVLFDKVRRTIKDRAMSVQARRVRVVRAILGGDAGLVGAAILVKGYLT